jgi:hypothetical protein
MIRYLWGACLSLALVGIAPVAAEAQQLVGEGAVPGTTMEIRDLKRDDGGTVTLRFQLSNQSDGDLNLSQLAASDADRKEDSRGYPVEPGFVVISAVHLIDAGNKKKYLVVLDTAKKCACAVLEGTSLKKGQKVNLWARFPAPPESGRKVTVVVPRFDPVDVPITR